MKKEFKKIFLFLKKNIKGINHSIMKIKSRENIAYIILLFDMMYSYIRYGIDYDEYRIFEFYNLSYDKRNTYMGHVRHKKFEKKFYSVKHLVLLNNREKFYIKFKKYLNREIYNINELSFKEFEELALKKHELVCRGNNLKSENNTLCLNLKNFRSPAFLLEKSRVNKLYLVEASIKQNKVLEGINSYNMNTISVITLKINNNVNIVCSYIKFGISKEYNYDVNSSENIMGLIDIKTGKVKNKFLGSNGEVYCEHPISRVKLTSFEVPLFDEIKKIAVNCANEFDESLEMEWNFVISNNKVFLINGKLWNDYILVQSPLLLKNKVGLMPYYKDKIKK